MIRRFLVFSVLLACACSNSPVRIESRAPANLNFQPPENYIVAAVDNEPQAFLGRPGSTPRGYDTIAAYGPTPAAVQRMRALEHDYHLREVSAWPIGPLHKHCAVLEIPLGADRSSLLAALAGDPRISLVQPLQSFVTRSDEYNDPYVGLQSGFKQMDVAGAHPWSRGEGVRIAIIDTGADTHHPDLRGSILTAANFVDSDDLQFQRDRHGTELAGVIAAVANNRQGIVGIAPGARLLMFKACWQTRADADLARCNSFTLARAMVAAFDAHAQIINLSLTGPQDPLLSDLFREGLRRGVLFIGAAGSLMHQTGLIEVASSGEQSGGDSALYAPGREILTLLPGGRYDFASGDSIAAAQVSGVAALLLAKNAGLTAGAAYRLLRDTSESSVDACAAVAALLGHGSCAVRNAMKSRAPADRGAVY